MGESEGTGEEHFIDALPTLKDGQIRTVIDLLRMALTRLRKHEEVGIGGTNAGYQARSDIADELTSAEREIKTRQSKRRDELKKPIKLIDDR